MSQQTSLNFSSISDEALRLFEQALPLLKTVPEFSRWQKYINKIIFSVRKSIRDKHRRRGNLNKLEANLALLKSYRELLKKKSTSVKISQGLNVRTLKQNLKWINVESCFGGRIRTGVITNLKIKDPEEFLSKAFRLFNTQIKKSLEVSMLKVNVIFYCKFVKPSTGEIDLKNFSTVNEIINRNTNLKVWYKNYVKEKLLKKMETFQERDSGWALLEVINLKVNINSFVPMGGGISTYIELPKWIQLKKAVVNIKNNDQYCFLWAIKSKLFPRSMHSYRISSYPDFRHHLIYQNFTFPMRLVDILHFEKINNLRINVYALDGKKNQTVVPVYLSKSQVNDCIHLLMIPTE